MTRVQPVPSNLIHIQEDVSRGALMLLVNGRYMAALDAKYTTESVETLIHRFACTIFPFNQQFLPYDHITGWGLVYTGKKMQHVDVANLPQGAILEVEDGQFLADGTVVDPATPGVETFKALYKNGTFTEDNRA